MESGRGVETGRGATITSGSSLERQLMRHMARKDTSGSLGEVVEWRLQFTMLLRGRNHSKQPVYMCATGHGVDIWFGEATISSIELRS